jgi:hypothetical protein
MVLLTIAASFTSDYATEHHYLSSENNGLSGMVRYFWREVAGVVCG